MPGPRVAGSRRRRDVAEPSAGPVPPAAAEASAGAAGRTAAGPVPPSDAAEPATPELLVVGRIGRPQGIRGEVSVQVRTDDPDQRFRDGAVLLTEPAGRGPLTVLTTRDQNGRLMIAFEGVFDRNGAEALRDTLLLVDRATLPPPEDQDTFHDFQLVGLRARLPAGTAVGEVAEVLHLPHGDVLVIAHHGRELLVPFVKAMVPVVDLPGGELVIDPPEGLLELGGAADG